MVAAALPSPLIELPFPTVGRSRVAWAVLASIFVHGLALGWLPGMPQADSFLREPLQVLLPAPPTEPAAAMPLAQAPIPEPPQQESRAAVRPAPPATLRQPPVPLDKTLDTTEVVPDWLAQHDRPPPDSAAAPAPGPAQPIAAQAEPAPRPMAADPTALASYGRTIAGAVAAYRRYPRLAQLRQWQGTTVLQLELAPDGQLAAVRVLSSSGYEILDRQALEMVRAAAPLPPPPAGLSGRALAVDVPVVFRLES
jgi:protein TonB